MNTAMETGMERVPIRRVLCPVQLTDFSGGLLAIGSTLARRYGADLFTVHVLEDHSQRPDAVRRAGGRPSSQEAAIRLRGLIRTNSDLDPRDVTSAVRRGDAVDEIVAYAERMNADIIVGGRLVPPRFPRFAPAPGHREPAAGPDIARAARRAVLTVRTVSEEGPVEAAVPHAGVFKHIVCGVDFSRASLHALSHAIALAEEAAGLLTVVHVVAGDASAGWPDKQERLTRKLYDFVARNVRAQCGVRAVVTVGNPVDELSRVVLAERADLLVLGVKDSGRAGDPDGCTATLMSDGVDCPVLLVPAASGAATERLQ